MAVRVTIKEKDGLYECSSMLSKDAWFISTLISIYDKDLKLIEQNCDNQHGSYVYYKNGVQIKKISRGETLHFNAHLKELKKHTGVTKSTFEPFEAYVLRSAAYNGSPIIELATVIEVSAKRFIYKVYNCELIANFSNGYSFIKKTPESDAVMTDYYKNNDRLNKEITALHTNIKDYFKKNKEV